MSAVKKKYFVQLSGAPIWPELCDRLSPYADLTFGILDGRNIPDFEKLFPTAKFIDGTELKHGIWDRRESSSLPDEIRLHPAFLRREQQAFYGMQRQFTGGFISYTNMRIVLSSLADFLWGIFQREVFSFGVLTEAPHTHAGQILAGIAEACDVPIIHFQQTSICSAVRPVVGPDYQKLDFSEFETDNDSASRLSFLTEEFPLIESFVEDAHGRKRYAREVSLLERDRELYHSPKGMMRRFFIPYHWRLEESNMLRAASHRGKEIPHSIASIAPRHSISRAVIVPALRTTREQSRSLRDCRSSFREVATDLLPQRYATFFLHFEPEKTSVPDGGLFGDQILAVRRCAESLDPSTTLVVREHPSQLTRLKRGFRARTASYYREISAIPNVVVLSETVPHSDVLEGSRVIFTLTGKVALEALALRIPVIPLGYAWYEGLPGIFTLSRHGNVAECVKAADSFTFPLNFDLKTEIQAHLAEGFLQVRINPSSSRYFQGTQDPYSLFNVLRFFVNTRAK